MLSPVVQLFSSNKKFQCVPNVYGCKVFFFFCVVFLLCIQFAGLRLQSESSLPESKEGIIKECWGALSLNLAIGVKLRQKLSAGLSARFNGVSLLVHQNSKAT